ncbi:hypothetical protein DB347_17540 [Opitutaceae bacterium EW11]|nr:hypothetical protein DB347_17540 [Opitutaceae bacterium EW11]
MRQNGAGVLLRIDLDGHRSIGSVAIEIRRQANGLRPNEPLTASAAPGLGNPSLSSAISSPSNESLFAALDYLNHVAARQASPVALALDGYPKLRQLGGALIDQAFRNVLTGHPKLGFVISGSESQLSPILTDSAHPLYGRLEARNLEPLEPRQLASWIDGQFAKAQLISAGVGTACVDRGGPRTSDILDLASRTFDLAAGPRFANGATVEKAMGQAIQEKSADCATIWEQLPIEERKALKELAQMSGVGAAVGDAAMSSRASVGRAESPAMKSLEKRGLIEKIGSAGFHFESPTFKGWAIQAELNVRRERATPTSAPTTRFAFNLNAGRTEAANPTKGVRL